MRPIYHRFYPARGSFSVSARVSSTRADQLPASIYITLDREHIAYACFLDLPGIFPWGYIDEVDRLAMAAALDKGFDMLSSDATRDARARLDHASPRLKDAA